MTKLLILLFLTLPLGLRAAGLPGEQIVQFGEGKQTQTFRDLRIAALPALDTRVIYSRRGLVFPGAKGLALIYPGTSGRVTSEYGIERSLAPIANEFVKRGYAVIAFQPPIYHLADDAVARRPYLEKYGNLEGNLRWLMSTVEFAQKQIPEGQSLDLFNVSRSTFAAVSLEALHLYAGGDEAYRLMGRFNGVLAMGLDGHSPEEIAEWHASEVDFFLRKHPEKADEPVVMAAPKIFGAMTHQTQLGKTKPGLSVPYVISTAGSRDEFAGGKISKLLKPVVAFSKHHPDLAVNLALHDGHHDPGRQVTGLGKEAGPMSRLRMVLDRFLDPGLSRGSGLSVTYHPERAKFEAPLSREEIGLCHAELLVAGYAAADR